MEITSISSLAEYGKGQVVRLPDFAEGQPFVARIRRPSMLALVKSGKIPNRLIHSANNLFMGNGDDSDSPEYMKNLFDVFDVICEACFVEPTYSQIKEAGLELTDDQYMFIFSYTQKGVKALESFRKQQQNLISSVDGATV